MHQRRRFHARAPRHHGGDHADERDGGRDPATPVPSAARAAGKPLAPGAQFGKDRPQDERHDLDGEQHDSQHFESHVIHQQGDAQKQKEAVDPHAERVGDERALAPGREDFGALFAQPEQPFAQPPPRQRKGTVLQVGHVQRIGQQEVTVKAHQRIEIDGQGQEPGRRRQREGGAAQHAIWQKAPGQRGPSRQRGFGQHACGPDRQALSAAGEPPGARTVGVQDRPHHHERHTHGRHAAAVVLGGVRVAKFVQHLGRAQCDGRGQCPFQREKVQECM